MYVCKVCMYVRAYVFACICVYVGACVFIYIYIYASLRHAEMHFLVPRYPQSHRSRNPDNPNIQK